MNKKFLAPIFTVLFMAALFIKNSEFTAACVKGGLDLCFTTIIPSLFPLMVISEILCRLEILDLLGGIFKANKNPFGISGKSLSAVIMGLLFGFPIGTRALISLYDRKEISKDEFESCAGFCGIPSFGFLVNAVGINLFSSNGFGWFMYFSAVLSALISGLVFRKKKKDVVPFTAFKCSKTSFSEAFTSALSSSVIALITLCGYIVFFSCVVRCILREFSSAPIGGLIASITELTAGVGFSAGLGGHVGAALCGFAIGWGGLSVHCQAISFISPRIDSYSLYWKQKILQGALCAVLALFYSLAFRLEPCVYLPTVAPILPDGYLAFVFFLFFFSLILIKQKSRST